MSMAFTAVMASLNLTLSASSLACERSLSLKRAAAIGPRSMPSMVRVSGSDRIISCAILSSRARNWAEAGPEA
ncbi:hypothetical protein D3C72_1268430 [compost metagenome]